MPYQGLGDRISVQKGATEVTPTCKCKQNCAGKYAKSKDVKKSFCAKNQSEEFRTPLLCQIWKHSSQCSFNDLNVTSHKGYGL